MNVQWGRIVNGALVTLLAIFLFGSGLVQAANECPPGPDGARCNVEAAKEAASPGNPNSAKLVGPPAPSNTNKSSTTNASSSDLPDIATANFKLNPKDFSPSKKTYNSGTGNITTMIGDIVRIMLISISTLAVLCIAVGGAMMSVSGGNSDRVSKGKAIVTHSIQAIGLSLSAYLIIQFVSWVIA